MMDIINYQGLDYALVELLLVKPPGKPYSYALFQGKEDFIIYTTRSLTEKLAAYPHVILRIQDVDWTYMCIIFKENNLPSCGRTSLIRYVLKAPNVSEPIKRLRKLKLLQGHGDH